jgi:pimeloyl-ACP methyl ester carboxylesterase
MATTIIGRGGLRLACDRWEACGAQPVVLLHGGGQTRGAWGATAEMLATDGYEVLSLDLRGHGDSAWSTDLDYGLSAFRDDIRLLLGAFDRPAVLIGASLGGTTSLLVAGEHPATPVAALVLVDITATPTRQGTSKILAFMRSAPNGFASIEEAIDAVASYLPHRPRSRDPASLLRNLRERDGRLHWHWDPSFLDVITADTFDNPGRLEQAARAISAPTLLVRGAESEVVSDTDAAGLAELIRHVEIVEVPKAGHMVAGDQNTAFSGATRAFVQRVAPAHAAPNAGKGRPS